MQKKRDKNKCERHTDGAAGRTQAHGLDRDETGDRFPQCKQTVSRRNGGGVSPIDHRRPPSGNSLRGRPERLRQDHAPALHRRPDRTVVGRTSGRRQARCGASRRRRHGVPAFRAPAVEDRVRERRLRAGDGGRTVRPHQGARRPLSRPGRPHRIRAALPLSTVRRHAAARRPRARARHQSVDPPDGRAVRRARCTDARDPAGRTAAIDAAAGRTQDHGVRHPFDRRGDPARRPRRGDDRPPRPHQGSHRCSVRATARRRGSACRPALRRNARHIWRQLRVAPARRAKISEVA